MEKWEEILFRFGELKSLYSVTGARWVIYCLILGVFQKSGRFRRILKSSRLKDVSGDQPKRKPDIKFNQQRLIMG